MPKYKCTNEDCPKYNETEYVIGGKIKIIDGEAVTEGQACPECGSKREVIRESGMTTHIAGTNDQRLRMERQW